MHCILAWSVRLALLLPLAVSAASEHSDLFDLSLEELGQVRITGSTLTEKDLRSVPASVTVYSRSDIRKLAVNYLTDLMNYVPGFQATRGTDASFDHSGSIRGRRVAVSNREILVLLNGMKIDGFFTGGISGTVPNLPLYNVDRIEFIRGPGSAIYGSNAYTGVINIITDSDNSGLDMAAGSDRFRQLQNASQFSNDAVSASLFLQANANEGETFRVNAPDSGSPATTQDPQHNYHGQIQLHVGDNSRAQLVLSETTADDFYVLGNLRNGFNQYQMQYAGLLLEHSLELTDNLSSYLSGGLQISNTFIDAQPITAQQLGTISDPASTDPLLIKVDVQSREYWLRWHNDWTTSAASSLQFGAEYRQPRITHGDIAANYNLEQLSHGDLPIDYYGDLKQKRPAVETARMDVLGVYAQYQYRWNDYVEAIAGARFDTYSQVGNSVSPRLGLITHPDTNDSVKLLYGQAFRAPQANELYNINNPVQLGNPNLKPETVETWELIWLHDWDSAQLTLNYFQNRWQDAIRQVLVGATRVFVNSEETDRSEGVEAELNLQLAQRLKLHVTATRMLDTPDYFYRESRELYSAYLIYSASQWFASFSTHYQSDKATQINSSGDRKSLDGFVITNLKAGYNLSDAIQTRLEILNLFDEAYYTPSVSDQVVNGAPNRGREVRLGLEWSY